MELIKQSKPINIIIRQLALANSIFAKFPGDIRTIRWTKRNNKEKTLLWRRVVSVNWKTDGVSLPGKTVQLGRRWNLAVSLPRNLQEQPTTPP